MNEIRIPFGLCDVTFNGITHSNMADEAVFEATPEYEKVRYGQMQNKYFLTDYVVSLDLALTEENYNTLKLSYPALRDYCNGGLYDNPTDVAMEGKPLIIHPTEASNSKEYDITIFNAILDPEKPFTRTFGKETDIINVRFLGQPWMSLGYDDFKSYFFIGDVDTAELSINFGNTVDLGGAD